LVLQDNTGKIIYDADKEEKAGQEAGQTRKTKSPEAKRAEPEVPGPGAAGEE
jgi:hypothetical protein